MLKKEKKIVDKSINRNIVVSEGIIRPTGLLDPIIIIKPVLNQVDDVLEEVRKRVEKNQRVLITTLTKKFAQELDIYFKQISIKSAYIHSEVSTLDRLDILSSLRNGKYDVLIGINLLREGLDLPEVSLVAIFDADKEGFLRSRTSLIQIIGRAARHSEGTVIMYCDRLTKSIEDAINETNRRREIQKKYNLENNITPTTTVREHRTISDYIKQEKEEKLEEIEDKVIYSPFGFVEVNKKDEIEQYEISSNNANSAFGSKKRTKQMRKAQQLYANFEQIKTEITSRLNHLSKKELSDKLQIAVDALNFEEAAAIRDLLNDKNTEK